MFAMTLFQVGSVVGSGERNARLIASFGSTKSNCDCTCCGSASIQRQILTAVKIPQLNDNRPEFSIIKKAKIALKAFLRLALSLAWESVGIVEN